MRYNPATDRAVSIDQIAAECRVAITRPRLQPKDVFAAESCRIWAMCRRTAADYNNRSKVSELDAMLAEDMHKAMHHRPHQPEI
jgi:hypothetical protein